MYMYDKIDRRIKNITYKKKTHENIQSKMDVPPLKISIN